MKYYVSTTEFNCRIDLHAPQRYVCLMDRQGQKLVHCTIKDNDFQYFLKLIQPYRHSLTVCADCMFGWYWLAHKCPSAARVCVGPSFEWIAAGFTAVCFWNAAGPLLLRLEGRVRFGFG